MLNVNYQSAKTEVERLVERFARLSARNRKGYNEPATRQEFILPLFRALGWNIEDTRSQPRGEGVTGLRGLFLPIAWHPPLLPGDQENPRRPG